MKQKKSWKYKMLVSFIVLLAVLSVVFFIFVSSYYKAQSFAQESMQSDSHVKVEEGKDLLFKPVENTKKTGFIFYQGAKVEAASYAPMAKEIATQGYTVIIPNLPFKLAVFSPDRADKVIRDHPEIDTWVIGGHSLGGVMASDYASRHDKINGLILLASYPQKTTDLSKASLEVLSMWGSNDQVADIGTVKGAESFMPAGTQFIEIEGGNHAGFGDYGKQKGDGKASITNKEQIQQTTTAILKLLDGLQRN